MRYEVFGRERSRQKNFLQILTLFIERALLVCSRFMRSRKWKAIMGLLARRNPFHDKVRKKNVRTDAPTEHGDTKILGTVVELKARERLPLGLRVDTFVSAEK